MKNNTNKMQLQNALKRYVPEEMFATLDGAAAERIREEIRLFDERGWEEYVLFLADFLKRLDEKDMLFFSGSAAASFLLGKLADPACDDAALLRKPLDELAGGALRLHVTVVRPDAKLLTKSVEKLDKALTDALAAHPLQSRQKMVSAPADLNGACDLVVLSDGAIPDADFDRIACACCGDGEAAAPEQYLIVAVETKLGI